MTYAIDIENVRSAMEGIYGSDEWKQTVEIYKNAKRIFFIGHGGNLAIADHAAVDCTRLTGGEKVGMSTGSAIVATSFINDNGWDNWLKDWVSCELDQYAVPKCAIVFTGTGKGDDILNATQFLLDSGVPVIFMTARTMERFHGSKGYVELLAKVDYYHESEVIFLGLTYDLIVASGYECPKIKP